MINKLLRRSPGKFTQRSALVEFYGDSSTGRTTLALTAPPPIVLLHDAEKIAGVLEPVAKNKEIYDYNFGGVFAGTEDKISKDAKVIWDNVDKIWKDAFDFARTIIVDTHPALWALLRLKSFGGVKPKGGRHEANWGPVNAQWYGLLNRFRMQKFNPGTNVILIGSTQDEWKKTASNPYGVKTGNTIRTGQGGVFSKCDVVLRTYVEGGDFSAIVEKGWFKHSSMCGLELSDDFLQWHTLMGFITETDADEWL